MKVNTVLFFVNFFVMWLDRVQKSQASKAVNLEVAIQKAAIKRQAASTEAERAGRISSRIKELIA